MQARRRAHVRLSLSLSLRDKGTGEGQVVVWLLLLLLVLLVLCLYGSSSTLCCSSRCGRERGDSFAVRLRLLALYLSVGHHHQEKCNKNTQIHAQVNYTHAIISPSLPPLLSLLSSSWGLFSTSLSSSPPPLPPSFSVSFLYTPSTPNTRNPSRRLDICSSLSSSPTAPSTPPTTRTTSKAKRASACTAALTSSFPSQA